MRHHDCAGRRVCALAIGVVAAMGAVPAHVAGAAPAAAMTARETGTSCTASPLTELGTLGGTSSYATDLNNHGVIVGLSKTAEEQTQAFVWRDGVMTSLTPDTQGNAVAINDRGDIAGTAFNKNGTMQHATIWRDGVPTDLGTLGGRWSKAQGMNSKGEVIGRSNTPRDDPGSGRAFLWSKGVMRELPAEGSVAVANDINDHGDVVGFLENADGSGNGAALWRRGRLIKLVPPFGVPATAVATKINNRGQVLGSISMTETGGWNSFLLSDGVYTNLGSSTPWALNNRGAVALIDYNTRQGARWYQGTTTLLPTLGVQNGNATDINDRGMIVGNVSAPRPESGLHAVVWTASDELIDIGAISGEARFINDRGRVIGYSNAYGDIRAIMADVRCP